jgi:hypothetical protein
MTRPHFGKSRDGCAIRPAKLAVDAGRQERQATQVPTLVGVARSQLQDTGSVESDFDMY